MKMKYIKKISILMMILCLFMFYTASRLEAKSMNPSELANIQFVSSKNNYQAIFNEWTSEGYDSITFFEYIQAEDFKSDASLVNHENINAILLQKDTHIVIEIDIEQSGLYEIWIDYFVVGQPIRNPMLTKSIAHQENDFEIQYNEDSGILLPLTFQKNYEEPTLDRYGDEIPIRVSSIEHWINENKIFDPAGIIKTPLKNLFLSGTNKIKIELNNHIDLMISGITVSNSEPLPKYASYIDSYLKQGVIRPNDVMIKTNAEDYSFKGSTNVTAFNMMQPHMSRYQFNKRYLNAIELSKVGQWVEYDVMVEESGLYKLAIKAELTNRGLPVFRRIAINGKVPFEEFNHLRIDFEDGWSNYVLSNQGETFEVYLEKGNNTIRIESSPGLNTHFQSLQTVLDEIQALSMEITSLTGGIQDRSRTWNIQSFIPDIVPRLEFMAQLLMKEYDILTSYSKYRAAQFNIIRIAANQLLELASDPNRIVERSFLLNEGSASSANMISQSLTNLLNEPMIIDCIYVFSNTNLPRAKSPWYVNFFEGLRMFFFSFFDPRYDLSLSNDPKVVKVWVSRSKLHVDLMQRMADELFTKETNIEVELMVLPNASRIILANAANNTPDLVLSLGGGSIYDYALRNMIADLRPMEGFQDVAQAFNPNTFVPYIFEDGVYAMPETQDVALLFYRKDILSSLELEIPQTWDHVLGMLPLLQSLGMNFYHPISGTAATKSINHMSPLIYQNNGDFYGEYADEILLRNPNTINAVKYIIDLYNIYNLPLQIGSFYERFRNGTLPIGIGDQNMYIQLKYAAPEIIGQWGIAPIPGIKNDEGVIERWDTALGTAGFIFENSNNKDNAWAFLKWWVSADIQAEFSFELISNFGELFLNMTANIDGFIKSAWPEDSKDAIIEQWNWIRIPPRLPGYYILERELSNVYNKAVFEQTNFRRALDEAYFNVYREIERKLAEFEYDEQRRYRIPNNRNIHEWIGE